MLEFYSTVADAIIVQPLTTGLSLIANLIPGVLFLVLSTMATPHW